LTAKVFSMGIAGVSPSTVRAHLASQHLHHKVVCDTVSRMHRQQTAMLQCEATESKAAGRAGGLSGVGVSGGFICLFELGLIDLGQLATSYEISRAVVATAI
jgi:hypothetical protein